MQARTFAGFYHDHQNSIIQIKMSTSSSIQVTLENNEEAIELNSIGDAKSILTTNGLVTTTTTTTEGSIRPQPSINSLPATSNRSSFEVDEEGGDGETLNDETPVLPSQLPPVDKGRSAWTFLTIATLLECLIWGMGNSYGTFQDYHLYSNKSPLYGSSSAATAAAGTLITAGQYFAPFLFLGLLNAFPQKIKLFQIITISLSALGLVAASFNPNVTSVTLFQGLLSGWSGAAFYTPALVWLPEWFDKKRGLATGVIFLGSGVGGVIWPFVLNGLLQNVGFSWTLRILCIIQLILGSFIVLFLRPRLPINHSISDQQQQNSNSSRHDSSRRRRNILRSILPSHNKILHSPLGVLNCLVQFLQNASFWTVSYYIAPYATSLGLQGMIPTALLATFNGSSALSYVIIGRLCDTMPHIGIVLSSSACGTLLVGLLLGFARSFGSLFSFAILYGLLNGGFSTTMSPMAREMATIGSTDNSSVFLEFMAWRGLGGVVGPLISSLLYKTSSQPSTWGDEVAYGSHGLGPIIVFTTALNGIVSLIGLGMIPLRKSILQ